MFNDITDDIAHNFDTEGYFDAENMILNEK